MPNTLQARLAGTRAHGVLAVLALLATTGCAQVERATQKISELASGTTSTTSPASVGIDENAAIELSVCPDRTSSVEDLAPGLANQVPLALASALESRAAHLVTPSSDGSLVAVPALRVRMTSVASNSFLQRPLLDVNIPGVRSLAAAVVDGDDASAREHRLDTLRRRTEAEAMRSATAHTVATLR